MNENVNSSVSPWNYEFNNSNHVKKNEKQFVITNVIHQTINLLHLCINTRKLTLKLYVNRARLARLGVQIV